MPIFFQIKSRIELVFDQNTPPVAVPSISLFAMPIMDNQSIHVTNIITNMVDGTILPILAELEIHRARILDSLRNACIQLTDKRRSHVPISRTDHPNQLVHPI